MDDDQTLCACEVCLAPNPAEFVIPQPSLDAIRRRRARAGSDRPYCPRCAELLGRVEVVVDAVSYSHFVQPCSGCLALWVVS